jgi:hypothetical protein
MRMLYPAATGASVMDQTSPFSLHSRRTGHLILNLRPMAKHVCRVGSVQIQAGAESDDQLARHRELADPEEQLVDKVPGPGTPNWIDTFYRLCVLYVPSSQAGDFAAGSA